MDLFIVLFMSIVLMIMIVYLATLDRKNKYVMIVLAPLVFIAGFIVYGLSYSSMEGYTKLEAALHTTRSTLLMFAGASGFDDVKDSVFMQSKMAVLSFKLVHFMALIVTARAVLVLLGDKIAAWIRAMKTRKGNLFIIYGVNSGSVSLATELSASGSNGIVFVDREIKPGFSGIIDKRTNAILITDKNAVNPTEKFLKQIGAHKSGRKIVLYAMHEDEARNIEFATKFDRLLREIKIITKDRVSLSIISRMDMEFGKNLQASNEEVYGFGSVMEVDKYYLAARRLVGAYPPADYIEFDTKRAKAARDFEAAVVGFGKLGQAVLKQIVENSQFEGSHFKATVYDPDIDEVRGHISQSSKPMFDNYDIELSKIKAGSNAFYEDLFSKKNLAYIVVCVGNDHDNNEMAWDIISYIRQCKMRTVVLRCDEKNIYCYNCEKGVQETISVYVRENIDVALSDRKAIALNYIYCRSNIDDHKTPEEYWMDAGYMDKMSCRASADFTYALCKMAGLDMKELATTGKLDLTAEQLCNLARTEHLRWNAFHHVMGYSKMTDEVLAERIAKYQSEVKENGKTSYRIQKDNERKMHICLVPWEDLDELSKMYNQVTGKNKDYKKDDENNVMLIPELLHISAKNM